MPSNAKVLLLKCRLDGEAYGGAILGDEVMAAALIDRLMHHCHVVNIRGNSYRMREHTDLLKAISPGAEKPAKPTRTRRQRKEVATT